MTLIELERYCGLGVQILEHLPAREGRPIRRDQTMPHVAQNTSGRSSAIDGRTMRHGGYAVS
jgi:Transposase DDE domain